MAKLASTFKAQTPKHSRKKITSGVKATKRLVSNTKPKKARVRRVSR